MKPAPVPPPDAWLLPSDLDEDIVTRSKAMVQRLAGLGSAPDHLSDGDKKRFHEARKIVVSVLQRPAVENLIFGAGFSLFICLWGLFFFSLCLRHAVGDVLGRALLIGLSASVLWTFALIRIARKVLQKRKEGRGMFLPQVIALAAPLLNHKTPLEKAYCEAAAALLQEPPSAWGGPQAVQSLLHDLRDLFHIGKQTEAKRAQIGQAMSHQSLAEVDAEAARLLERVHAASDGDASATLQQSLVHLEGRRARVRAMEPLRERLEAQEEAVYQALREAQTTFSSTHVSGWAETPTPLEFAPQPWGETAQRLRQQTAAVERAVQEVMGGAR